MELTNNILLLDAMLARYICCRPVCVRLSVRSSVTSLHCTETAKHRITQTTPYDSTETLVYMHKISAKFQWDHP